MKKIIIYLLAVFISTTACFASSDKEIKKAYKQINKICKSQNVKELKEYIKSNPDSKESIYTYSNKLIMLCIKKDNPEMLEILMKNNANMDVRIKKYNRTPLMYACYYNGNPIVIKLLLSHKYDVNDVNSHGNTPLMTLCYNHPYSKGVYYLIDAGSDLFRLNDDNCAYSILPAARKKEVLNYYNKTVSKKLCEEFVDKNKTAVLNRYGIPAKKFHIDNNVEVWEYSSRTEHYVELQAVTTGGANYNT